MCPIDETTTQPQPDVHTESAPVVDGAPGPVPDTSSPRRPPSSPTRLLEAHVEALSKDLAQVKEALDEIKQGVLGTMGYRIRQLYECGDCSSKGKVITRVRCASCGNETWWGWWSKA
jgi:hypothetical protein